MQPAGSPVYVTVCLWSDARRSTVLKARHRVATAIKPALNAANVEVAP